MKKVTKSKMFFSLLLLSQSANFVLDENSHEYVVECATGLSIDVMPSEKMSILYYSNQKGSTITSKNIATGEEKQLAIQDDEIETGLYKSKIDDLGEKPLKFTINCPAQDGRMTVALRGTQNVTSDTTLFALIITCIVIISFVILIIIFQFFTFHHRKYD